MTKNGELHKHYSPSSMLPPSPSSPEAATPAVELTRGHCPAVELARGHRPTVELVRDRPTELVEVVAPVRALPS
jgi:hypothetical protein